MTPAYAYLRVSGDDQIDGDGFARQMEACQRYAAANGLEIAGEYREEGVTGKRETDNRPAWLRMIVDAQESGIQTLLVEKLDRLARDLVAQEMTIRNCAKRGLVIHSAAEGDTRDDPENPTRTMIRQILGAVAQCDRAYVALKLLKARKRKRSNGERCEGRKPYGSRPGEAEALAQMQAWRREGHNWLEISRRATAAGLPTRSGSTRWHHETVQRILKRADARTS